MQNSFFQQFDKLEQARRHINSVYSLFTESFATDKEIVSSLLKLRQERGHKDVYNYIYANVLSLVVRDLLDFLKTRYQLPQDIYEEMY